MANTSGSRSNRGFIIGICILVAAALAAFMAMRDTLDQDGSPGRGTGSQVTSGQTAPQGDTGSAGLAAGGQGSQGVQGTQGAQSGQAGSQTGPLADGTADNTAGSLPGATPGVAPGAATEAATGAATPGAAQGSQPGSRMPGNSAATASSGADRTQYQARVEGLSEGGNESAQGLSPYPSGSQPGSQSGPASTRGQAGQASSYPLDVPYPAAETPEQTQGGSGPLGFTDDMALFLVNNYWPKGTHPAATTGGISTAGLKTANMRYGTESRGIRLDGQAPVKGAAALSRFFTPGMLDSLYGNYADNFLASLREAAATRRVVTGNSSRPLTEAERREMYSIYAARAKGLAATLTAYANTSGIRALVDDLNYAESAVDAANRDYMESMGEYEIALEDKSPDLAAAKTLMEQDAAVYQDRIKAREAARGKLADALGRALDEDSRIYAASWAYRRGEANTEMIRTGAKILNDLSTRLAAEAR